MVLSPTDAKNSLIQRLAPAFRNLEKQIDSELVHAGGKRTTVSISTGYSGPYDNPRENIPYSAVDDFLDRYRQSGWQAKICSDQREGEWIEFSPAAQRNSEYNGPYGMSGARPYE